MFNREKRQEKREKDKATKEILKEQIKPRPTYSQKMESKARKQTRDEAIDKREEPIRDRLKALHAGEAGGDIAQMGSDLLYIGHLSSLHFQVQDQFSLPDKCMTRWTVHGKHDREFLGMAPTGRDVTFSGVTVSYFATISLGVIGSDDGGAPTVTQEYHYWDMVALLQQIQAP